jgi:hypothetical protein
MKSLIYAITMNIALMSMCCMIYLVASPIAMLIKEKLASKLDKLINVVLFFQLSWIFALCVDLFLLWVTK